MAWISFVIVVLLFYEPFLNWGSQILGEPASATLLLPWFDRSLTVPYMEYIRLYLYSLLLWAFLYGLLLATEGLLQWRAESLDRKEHFDLLRPIDHPAFDFRNGMLYAMWPQTLIRIAEFLAKGILGYQVGHWAIDGILILLVANLPGFLFDLLNLIATLLFDIDLQIVVLSLFTLSVIWFYRREQRMRYDQDVHKHDKERKKQLVSKGLIITRR